MNPSALELDLRENKASKENQERIFKQYDDKYKKLFDFNSDCFKWVENPLPEVTPVCYVRYKPPREFGADFSVSDTHTNIVLTHLELESLKILIVKGSDPLMIELPDSGIDINIDGTNNRIYRPISRADSFRVWYNNSKCIKINLLDPKSIIKFASAVFSSPISGVSDQEYMQSNTDLVNYVGEMVRSGLAANKYSMTEKVTGLYFKVIPFMRSQIDKDDILATM